MDTPVPKTHVATVASDISLCTGCNACEIVCALLHEGYAGPKNRRIIIEKDDINLLHKIYTCQSCEDPPCYEACPLKDEAMKRDGEKGIAYVDSDNCIGCGLCVRACPFEPKRIQISNEGKAIKCDLCRTREEGPACIEYCNAMVIGLSGTQVPTAPEGVFYE